MGLHDIDKTHGRRLNPTPNGNDQIVQRYAHGTVQNQNSGEEAQADGLKFLERQLIAKQDGFNKAAFGFYGEANKFGLKVADDGVDVLTATDDQLLFNSEQNVFKIVSSGTITFPALSVGNPGAGSFASGIATTTVPHGLSFTPAYAGFINDASGVLQPTPYVNFTGASGTACRWYTLKLTVDATNIYASIEVTVTGQSWSSSASTYSAKYYLLQETAN